MDMEKLYANLEKEEAAKRKVEEEAAKDFSNPNMLTMKAGNTYRVRLMYWANEIPGDRKVPIIEKTVHAHKGDDGNYHEVTCPVSDYLMGRSGYRMCPICTELSKLWDEKEKGSVAAADAYKKFKRKFKGYAVVYIVNDSDKAENNGTFKIMYINAIINKYLRKKIKGVDQKGNLIKDYVTLGFKAFNQSGRDLTVTVTQGAEFKEYECEFDEGNTLDITDAQIEQAYDDLDFEDHYTKHDTAKLQEFYETQVLEKEAAPANAEAAMDMAKEASKDPAPETKEEKAEVKEAKEEVAEAKEEVAEAKEEVKEEVAEVKEEKAAPSTKPKVDVQALLDGLPS